MNAGPSRRSFTALSPRHVETARMLVRTRGQEAASRLLGCGVTTLQKAASNGRLTPAAAERLATALDALGARAS